jgi:osmoprotectant transport system permease protein
VNRWHLFLCVLAPWLFGLPCTLAVASEPIERRVVVGSKNFNESYILGEILAQLLESEGVPVARRFGLGGTMIAYQALRNGEIDVYVEYTGTISQAILGIDETPPLHRLDELLADEGLQVLRPLGFNNTYALAMKHEMAVSRGISRISDLVEGHRDLRVVVSHEFLERQDGWPGLRRVYGFDWVPGGIEHGLAYQALESGVIDVMDVYSTDGELVRYDLTILADDAGFFPEYLAVPLVRRDLPLALERTLDRLGGTLDDETMQRLNADVVFGGRSFAAVASDFLATQGIESTAGGGELWRSLGRNTLRHLQLTALALGGAIIAGIALGIAVYRTLWLSRTVVYIAGLLQTIPSIALLALMIPLFGIGVLPAIVALFLYSLLPILRNTVTGLTTVDPLLLRVAVAMGLTQRQQLRNVYVPLALPGIFAGVRTAAIISIGTATLAAFIGAGGLGDPIVTGLALNDVGLILQGAVPAALLAIATELVFEAVERFAIPRHLVATRR